MIKMKRRGVNERESQAVSVTFSGGSTNRFPLQTLGLRLHLDSQNSDLKMLANRPERQLLSRLWH